MALILEIKKYLTESRLTFCQVFLFVYAFFPSPAKYSFTCFTTTPDNRKTAIKFGIAISPLNVSAIFHISPRSIVAPTIATSEYRVIGQNVLMANPSHQTFYPHYVSRSKQLHHPRLKDSFPIDSSHSFADK